MTEPTAGADNYLIGREIARGGMGSILEAEDTKLGRTVAVKVMLLDANADEVARRRFLREAEVLALLAHPNIVPIYDIVWEDGMPLFYCMKLVKGRTLQDILNDLRRGEPDVLREYPLAHLLQIFRKVCDAIAFAHSKGILHRDLKPANVMAGEFGEVMVMDWGLAKRMNDETRTTNDEPADHSAFHIRVSSFSGTLAGSVMGTPQYMSPEQAMGHVDELDERSDIFSLGGILYAILTLRPPVDGNSVQEMIGKVTEGRITPPVELTARATADGKASEVPELNHPRAGKRVPAALSSVAMKALRLDKSQRYQKVMALIADLEAWQSGFATSAEHAGAITQIKLLMPAAGESARILWQPPDEIRAALRSDAAGEFAAAGKENVNASTVVVLRKSGDTVTTLHTLRAAGGLNIIRMSPNGERFAAASAYNHLEIFDTATGRSLAQCDAAGLATIDDVRWLGSERLLGAGTHGVRALPDSDERLVLWDAATGRPVRDLRGVPGMACLAVAPGQRRFAAAGPDKMVRLRDAQSLELLSEFRAHDGAVTALAFHPSKPILATGSADLTIRLWNLDDGSLVEELRPSTKEPGSLHFSPSGNRLTSADAAGAVHVWELDAPAAQRNGPQPEK